MRALVTAAIVLSALAGTAAAQTGSTAPPPTLPQAAPSPPATTGSGAPNAPVGHRQPTQQSVPPAVRPNERRTPVDPLGPVPKICRQC